MSRRCHGVPAWGGRPAVDCHNDLNDDAAFRCASCDAEVIARQQQAEEQREDAGLRQLLRGAGLSEPFITGARSLETILATTPQHKAAVEAARKLALWTPAHGTSLGLIVRGSDFGVGKTHLAEGTIRECIRKGLAAKFVNHRDLNSRLQAAFHDSSGESHETIVQRYATVTVLALDDLGAAKPSRFTLDCLCGILNRRTRDQLPTIVTSNYTQDELAARLTPSDGDALDVGRVIDRLEELCPLRTTLRGLSLRNPRALASAQEQMAVTA